MANVVHLSVALIATDRCSATLPSVHWTPDTLPRHQSRALLALIDSLCPANMQTQLSFSATNRGSPLSVANSVHICENMCMHCNFQACPLTFLYNENTSKNTKVMLKRHPTRQLVSDSRKKLRKQKLNRTCCPLQCTKKEFGKSFLRRRHLLSVSLSVFSTSRDISVGKTTSLVVFGCTKRTAFSPSFVFASAPSSLFVYGKTLSSSGNNIFTVLFPKSYLYLTATCYCSSSTVFSKLYSVCSRTHRLSWPFIIEPFSVFCPAKWTALTRRQKTKKCGSEPFL